MLPMPVPRYGIAHTKRQRGNLAGCLNLSAASNNGYFEAAMEIKLHKVETHHLSEDQARMITLKYLQQLIWPGDAVKDDPNRGGLLLISTGEGRYDEEVIRKATPVDQAILKLISHLNTELNTPVAGADITG